MANDIDAIQKRLAQFEKLAEKVTADAALAAKAGKSLAKLDVSLKKASAETKANPD